MTQRLAFVSTNKNKFSETFIHQQIQELPHQLFLYSEGYLPTQVSTDRGQTYRKVQHFGWSKKSSKELLIRSFKKSKINIVLAQYGPSGVELIPIIQQLNLPLIVHFHGYDAFRNDVLETYGRNYKTLFDVAKAIVVVSTDMFKQLEKLGCPKEKIHLIPCGIDTEFFQPNAEIERNDFIACGRFVEKKGIQYTLEAFKKLTIKHPMAQLKLIGGGPLEKELKTRVEKYNLQSNVQFLGILSQEQVCQQLQSALCYVQHSIKTESNDSEGTPVSMLEALATGLPVVSTKHAGIIDLVRDRENGFLVTERDVENMYLCLLKIYESRQLSEELGRNARASFHHQYKKEHSIQKLTQLINSCLE